MNTILVPLNGSVDAEQVLGYLPLLAKTLQAQIQLLQVVSEADSYHLFVDQIETATALGDLPAMQRATPAHAKEMLQQHAKAYLDQIARQLRHQGVDVTCAVRCGKPTETIVETAKDIQATLIALSSHAHSGLRRWALGSVLEALVRNAPTPIFVVRNAKSASVRTGAFRRILVPLDGSPLAHAALPLATELATQSRSELILFSAVPRPFDEVDDPLPDLNNNQAKLLTLVQQAITDQNTALPHHRIPITTAVSYGPPVDAIVDAASACSADLIVMSTHGYSGLRQLVLGSVADKVLRTTATPLLLVRA